MITNKNLMNKKRCKQNRKLHIFVILVIDYQEAKLNLVKIIRKNKKKMKIDWSVMVTIILAMVVYKLLDKYVLSKVTEKLEENFA